ncbi:MAG: FeoA domain-containing protein [Chloroflexi bacterium]|nr:FeoA domain-containing protein [Chloroflexota bacterium]
MIIGTLLSSPVETDLKITAIDGEKNLNVKLRQYGLFIGDQVRVLRLARLGGPVLIEANGREIALGRGIAGKISVEAV